MAQSLASQGWLHCGAAEFRHLCATVYGTTDLTEVRLREAAAAADSNEEASSFTILGNPLEALTLYNWTGSTPLFTQRLWATAAGTPPVRWVADSHRPGVLVSSLLDGGAVGRRRRPAVLVPQWDPEPHVSGPFVLAPPTGRARRRRPPDEPVSADPPPPDSLFVCVDWLLLNACPGRCWVGYHPSRWCHNVTAAGPRPSSGITPTPTAREDDWWVTRRALRAAILRSVCGTPADLALFDDTGAVSTALLPAILEDAASQQPGRVRPTDFFEPSGHPGWHRLRSDAPPPPAAAPGGGGAIGRREADRSVPPPWSGCPRTLLVRRLAEEHRRNQRHTPYNRSFDPAGPGLLLPYGRPVWDPAAALVRIPEPFTWSGCAGVEVNRAPGSHGFFLHGPGFGLAVDGESVGDFIAGIVHGIEKWRALLTLRRLVVDGGHGAPGIIRFGVVTGTDPRIAHAVVCALLSWLNPLTLLDEVIAVAVVVNCLVFRDNRTMTPDDLVVCDAWHRKCLRCALPSSATPWTPIDLTRLRPPSPGPVVRDDPPRPERRRRGRRPGARRRGFDDDDATTVVVDGATARQEATRIMERHRILAYRTGLGPVADLRRWNAWDQWFLRQASSRHDDA